MNRKLHHTVIALSATAGVFALLLLAGGPMPSPTPEPATLLPLSDDAAEIAGEAGIGIDASQSASAPASASQRQHLRRTRAALALPYFSFAQGLRHNRS